VHELLCDHSEPRSSARSSLSPGFGFAQFNANQSEANAEENFRANTEKSNFRNQTVKDRKRSSNSAFAGNKKLNLETDGKLGSGKPPLFRGAIHRLLTIGTRLSKLEVPAKTDSD
jgi:hypothetical protein